MSDAEWGIRDARGEWKPPSLPVPSPLFSRPWSIRKVLAYLFAPEGFLWPWNLFFAGIAVVSWLFFTPGLERTVRFEAGWIAEIFARNLVLLILVSGGLHLWVYTFKAQGLRFKYSNKWLARKDRAFLFANQTWDNIFWNVVSGCTIWTAYEAVSLWMWANRIIPYLDWRSHPIWFVVMMLGILFWRQAHFYFIHRLIHWKPLYNVIHLLHHRNVNIGPWSGLSMHPLEHLLYFSVALIHWVIPSHPIHVIFNLQHAGLTPALGHAGFDKLVNRKERGLKNEYYFHYLHHRFFTVNYGTEAVPLDKWFGSFNDGSSEAHDAMMARRAKERRPGARNGTGA